MGRPKLLQNPARVNLVLDQPVKELAMQMAAERGLSLGQFIATLIWREAEDDRVQSYSETED